MSDARSANTVRPVSVSIVSHGHGALVLALLSDLGRLDPPSVGEVILTLNVPEDEPFEPPPMPVPLRVVRNASPRGFGANHNLAFALARGAWFAILNPDLRLDTDPFECLLGAFETPEVAIAGPRIVDPAGRVAASARRLYTPLEIGARLVRPARAVASPDWIAGMFMLARADAFAAVGGFDERYFLYIEDVDLCTRLRAAGWRVVFIPEVTAIHDARFASHRSLRHLAWHVTGMLRYWRTPAFWRCLRARTGEPAEPAR